MIRLRDKGKENERGKMSSLPMNVGVRVKYVHNIHVMLSNFIAFESKEIGS